MNREALYVNSRLRGLIKSKCNPSRPMPDMLLALEEQISRIVEYQELRDYRANS